MRLIQRLGQESKDLKKRHEDLKKRHEDLKKRYEDLKKYKAAIQSETVAEDFLLEERKLGTWHAANSGKRTWSER